VIQLISIHKSTKWIHTACLTSYPAKNMRRNHDPGRANTKIASSVIISSVSRNGMQARISRFDTKNIALSGACIYEKMKQRA
jgi:hypothetical protein